MKDIYTIDGTLAGMPREDCVIALAANIIRGQGAVRAIASLLSLASVMAQHLDRPERIGLAEAMRGAADRVEQRQVERV